MFPGKYTSAGILCAGLGSVGCVFALTATGCVAITHSNSDYPRNWTRPSAAMIGRCPDITGTYTNAGESAGQMSEFNCNHEYPGKGSGYWACSMVLAKNLTLDDEAADATVTIEQPTDEAISLTIRHGHRSDAPVLLSRKHGDFSCNNDGVEFYHLGSGAPPTITALGIITTQVITASNRRSFRRAEDGSLLMTVTEELHHAVLIAGMYSDDVRTGHIRWPSEPTTP